MFDAVRVDDPTKGVAIKIEDVSKTRRPQIHYEYRVYRSLHRALEGAQKRRVPLVYAFLDTAGGDDRYQGLVLEKMGVNVQEIFDSYRADVQAGVRSKPLTGAEVFMVADQALECVRAVHDCGFVHRDIKPENFCVRHEDSNRLCIVDFGLSKRYRTRTLEHIPHRTGKGMLGTPRYTSIRCHEGHELSRRDDMESLLFMVLYLCRPGLPWQKTRNKDKKKRYRAILNKKRDAVETGSLFKGLGPGFAELFRSVRALGFAERPDYNRARELIHKSLIVS